jgi:hypothetical protein
VEVKATLHAPMNSTEIGELLYLSVQE